MLQVRTSIALNMAEKSMSSAIAMLPRLAMAPLTVAVLDETKPASRSNCSARSASCFAIASSSTCTDVVTKIRVVSSIAI